MNRFPSADSENSYHRTLVLRGSESGHATGESQAPSSASSSAPSVSPYTQVPERKARSVERRRPPSEIHSAPIVPPQTPLRGPITPRYESSYFPPITVIEDSSPPSTAISTAPGSSDRIGHSQTFNNKQASNVEEDSVEINSDSKGNETDKALKARSSRKWKHEISRPWFEAQAKKKSASRVSGDSEHDQPPKIRRSTSESLLLDSEGSEGFIDHSPSLQSQRVFTNKSRSLRSATVSTTDDEVMVSFEEPKEGLYCRTKRALGLKHGPVSSSINKEDFLERSMTAEALNRVASHLREFKLKGRETEISETASGLSIAAPSAISRWHHLQSLYSSSGHSSSSSLGSFTRRFQDPVHTPDPRSMYTGSDMNRYLAVELTRPEAPNFLPSEARRIDTPDRSNLKSYFETQSTAETPLSSSSNSATPNSGRFEDSMRSTITLLPKPGKDLEGPLGSPQKLSDSDYHRNQMKEVDADESQTPEQFVLSVPEHLPSSPLCPKHPKNKSKGKGVCVYHGRNDP